MKDNIKILGLHKDPWHDTGAAVIKKEGGRTFFVNLAEERCNREKDSRKFPYNSVLACMKEMGIKSFSEFDLVVMDYIINEGNWQKDFHKIPCSRDNFLNEIDTSKIRIVNHHLVHAYNVFYSSGFEKAAILIVDGRGSDKETQSLFIGDIKKGIRLIESTDVIGIGLLYEAITLKIGFKLLQEGKTMGLAPYGRKVKKTIFNFPKKFQGVITDYSKICEEGNYNLKISHQLIKTFRDKAKAAYEVQRECEKALLYLAQYVQKKTGAKYLCLSGGVALNSVSNYKLLEKGIFRDIFINPAASDTGIPLGAALYGFHKILNQKRNYDIISPYLGPSYSSRYIQKAISSFKGYKIVNDQNFNKTAKLLFKNKIVGFFQGRSEMGPRALGDRSILMSPLKAENKDILNAKVKFREAFRPFAPACLFEHVRKYFTMNKENPYMLFVPSVRENKQKIIPAVTHVDGTGRLQTVKKKFNPRFYKIINKFYHLTGVPVILNTSFNVAGEPIVETPEDAIKCFLSTKIDALLIGNYLLLKSSRKSEKKSELLKKT